MDRFQIKLDGLPVGVHFGEVLAHVDGGADRGAVVRLPVTVVKATEPSQYTPLVFNGLQFAQVLLKSKPGLATNAEPYSDWMVGPHRAPIHSCARHGNMDGNQAASRCVRGTAALLPSNTANDHRQGLHC